MSAPSPVNHHPPRWLSLALLLVALVLAAHAGLAGYVVLRQVGELGERQALRDVHLRVGRAYLSDGKHELAGVAFRRAAAVLGSDALVERAREELQLRGVVQSRDTLATEGQVSTEYLARFWLDESDGRTLAPSERALANGALCRVHHSAGALEAAIGRCRDAVQSAPHDAQLHFLLALLYQAQGDRDGSRRELLEATRVDPKHYMARLELAVIDLADSQPDLERVDGKLRELLVERNEPLTNYYLGLVLVRQGQFHEATVSLRAASALQDKVPGFRTHYGLALLRTGETAAGREQLAASFRRHRDPVALFHLGVSYREEGKLKLARDTLLRALGEESGLLAAYPELADVYVGLGDNAEARRYLQIYIDNASKQPGLERRAEQARVRMEALPTVPPPAAQR